MKVAEVRGGQLIVKLAKPAHWVTIGGKPVLVKPSGRRKERPPLLSFVEEYEELYNIITSAEAFDENRYGALASPGLSPKGLRDGLTLITEGGGNGELDPWQRALSYSGEAQGILGSMKGIQRKAKPHKSDPTVQRLLDWIKRLKRELKPIAALEESLQEQRRQYRISQW